MHQSGAKSLPKPMMTHYVTHLCRWTITRAMMVTLSALQWRHNGRDSVSNHQPHDCLLNRLFRRKENIKAPRHWPLCGEFTGDRWISRTNGQLRGKCFHLVTSSWGLLHFSTHIYCNYLDGSDWLKLSWPDDRNAVYYVDKYLTGFARLPTPNWLYLWDESLFITTAGEVLPIDSNNMFLSND